MSGATGRRDDVGTVGGPVPRRRVGVPVEDRTWRALPGPSSYVPYAGVDATYGLGEPPQQLVSRLHVIALTVAGEVIVCRSVEGWRFLPGGTREPGETLPQLARRELREEAGAEISGAVRVVAAHETRSRRRHPYRPHLPFPLAYWAYGLCSAEVTGPPTNPVDGETVVEVRALRPALAADELDRSEDRTHADVLRDLLARGVVPEG